MKNNFSLLEFVGFIFWKRFWPSRSYTIHPLLYRVNINVLFLFFSPIPFILIIFNHELFTSIFSFRRKMFSNQKLVSRDRRRLFDFILMCTRHQQIFKRFRLILCVESNDNRQNIWLSMVGFKRLKFFFLSSRRLCYFHIAKWFHSSCRFAGCRCDMPIFEATSYTYYCYTLEIIGITISNV